MHLRFDLFRRNLEVVFLVMAIKQRILDPLHGGLEEQSLLDAVFIDVVQLPQITFHVILLLQLDKPILWGVEPRGVDLRLFERGLHWNLVVPIVLREVIIVGL